MTRGVGAIFEPKTVAYDAARVVAQELSLPDDWLNDAVKGGEVCIAGAAMPDPLYVTTGTFGERRFQRCAAKAVAAKGRRRQMRILPGTTCPDHS